jgi:hypothetical protein
MQTPLDTAILSDSMLKLKILRILCQQLDESEGQQRWIGDHLHAADESWRGQGNQLAADHRKHPHDDSIDAPLLAIATRTKRHMDTTTRSGSRVIRLTKRTAVH